jgi:hypothetical protein
VGNQARTATTDSSSRGPATTTPPSARAAATLETEESDRYRTNLGFAQVTGTRKIESNRRVERFKSGRLNADNLGTDPIHPIRAALKVDGPNQYVHARVTVKGISGQGRVTAWASVIDSTTDPTFVPVRRVA